MSSRCTLSISCVYFNTKLDVFIETLSSLKLALDHAYATLPNFTYKLHVINNNNALAEELVDELNRSRFRIPIVELINGHGNIGYGCANNLSISQVNSNYHLVLNPDVILDEHALVEGIIYLLNHENVGLVTPTSQKPNGQPDYLAKRSPSFLVIVLRGLNIPTLNNAFRNSLERYIYKDLLPTTEPLEIELASGCFMLFQTELLKKLKGFSPDYFLYFEDFELSLRVRKTHKIVQLPKLLIVHNGGNASRKGINHIFLFFCGALTYLSDFKRHHKVRFSNSHH